MEPTLHFADVPGDPVPACELLTVGRNQWLPDESPEMLAARHGGRVQRLIEGHQEGEAGRNLIWSCGTLRLHIRSRGQRGQFGLGRRRLQWRGNLVGRLSGVLRRLLVLRLGLRILLILGSRRAVLVVLRGVLDVLGRVLCRLLRILRILLLRLVLGRDRAFLGLGRPCPRLRLLIRNLLGESKAGGQNERGEENSWGSKHARPRKSGMGLRMKTPKSMLSCAETLRKFGKIGNSETFFLGIASK